MDWGLALSTTATGLIVVFLVLIILIIVISILGKVMGSLTNRPKADNNKAQVVQQAPVESTVVAQSELEDGISEEVVAAISAAVAVIMSAEGKSCRIRSVKRTRTNRPVWSAAGIQDNTRPF